MKNLLAFILTFYSFELVFSQENKSITRYTQTVTSDTNLIPDFYNVEITVAEYRESKGRGRKTAYIKVPLDTIEKNLFLELKKIGINIKPVLTKVSEKEDNTYRNDPFIQGTYEFNVRSKDSISILYKHLLSKLNSYCLRRLKITPQLEQQSITNAKTALEAISLNRVKIDAEKFAEANKIAIDKIDNYQLSFNKIEKSDRISYYNGQIKGYDIDYSNPVYRLIVYYSFNLK